MFAISRETGKVLEGRFPRPIGRATVRPDDRETRTVASLKVSEVPTVFADGWARRRRRAVMAVARLQESCRRRAVESALAALSAILPVAETTPKGKTPKTRADALEALYEQYRMRRLHTVALMRFDGSRKSDLPAWARGIRRERGTVANFVATLHRDPDVNPVRRSPDGGRTWEVFTPPTKTRKTRKTTKTATAVSAAEKYEDRVRRFGANVELAAGDA